MTDRMIKVPIFNESLYGEGERLDIFMARMTSLAEKAPPEFRDSVTIEIESVGGYEGEHHTELDLYYLRPETEQEFTNRTEMARRRDLERETSERNTYNRMKAKFG